MGGINVGRVLLGGLVAGLLMNIGEFVLNDFVLKQQLEDYFPRHNFPPPGGTAAAVAVVMVFILGIVMILGYAAIRPRFGAGPKTAILAGLCTWFCAYFFNSIIGSAFGLIPTSILPILLIWGLVEYLLAALVGAWLYKET